MSALQNESILQKGSLYDVLWELNKIKDTEIIDSSDGKITSVCQALRKEMLNIGDKNFTKAIVMSFARFYDIF